MNTVSNYIITTGRSQTRQWPCSRQFFFGGGGNTQVIYEIFLGDLESKLQKLIVLQTSNKEM